jgi:putative flippase GtrA
MKIFFKYVISGGLAAAVHFLVLVALVEKVELDPTLASAIGFCMAIFVNYTMQYHWTFQSVGSHKTIFTRYVVVTFMMLGVNTVIFWGLYEKLGLMYLLAQAIATGTVMLLNFTINKNYTFVSAGETGKERVSIVVSNDE